MFDIAYKQITFELPFENGALMSSQSINTLYSLTTDQKCGGNVIQ